MTQSDVESAEAALSRAEDIASTDPGRALKMLSGAISSSVRRTDPTVTARASYLRARLLCERGEYGAAIGALQSARRDWLAADRPFEALRTDLGKATVMHELGSYRAAIQLSEGLLKQITRFHSEPGSQESTSAVTARVHNNLGNAWGRLGEHRKALQHYDVASNLFRGLGDATMQAQVDANRGLTYLKVGMGHRALDELHRAERVLVEEGQQLAAAKCRIDIAEAHLHLDDVETAIKSLADLPEVLAALDAVPELGRVHLTLGNALLRARLAAEARREARAAVDVFGELSMVDESGRAAYLCALVSMMLDEDDVALVELEEAARLFDDCEDAGFRARVTLAQAKLAERRGDLRRAEDLATRAVERLEGMDEVAPATLARLLLARLSSDGDALGHLAVAAEQIATLGLDPLLPSLELARARHDRRLGMVDAALDRLRAVARRTLDSPTPAMGEVELRLALQGATDDIIDELVDLMVEQGTTRSITEAWQWSTAGRGRTLNDFVTRALRAEGVVYGAAGPSAPGRRMRSSQDLPPLPEGPVLQFHVLGVDVVAFVIRDGVVEVRRLEGITRASQTLVAEWVGECAAMSSAARDHVGPGTAGHDKLRLILADLHRVLIEPLEPLLQDGYGAPLLVLPHRHLFSVPFEALQGRGEPFSARYRLAFAPGLVGGGEGGTPLDAISGPSLVVGVPDDKAPLIAEETARVIAALPAATALTGPKATAENFLANAPEKRLIHLACHGTYCAASPFYSALQLHDREIAAAEIVALDLAGSLVVLSACAAGQSSDVASEPAGLGWAFLAAGAGAVIASLWSVEDGIAVELMALLYAFLAAGMSARDALDAARVELARRWPNPYHWASFRFTCSPTNALIEGLRP